jgi:hypothetical protein
VKSCCSNFLGTPLPPINFPLISRCLVGLWADSSFLLEHFCIRTRRNFRGRLLLLLFIIAAAAAAAAFFQILLIFMSRCRRYNDC